MSKCQVTLTANAGVVISCDGLKIFVDALHSKKTASFSTLSSAMQLQMLNDNTFSNPDIIFFTHKHPDHYSYTLTQEAKRLYPKALLVSPIAELKNQFLLSEDSSLSLNGATLSFKYLRHSGDEYANEPNYGCIIDLNGFKVLVLGDCLVANPALKDWLKDVDIDLALLNFPWLTLRAGRMFISDYIKAEHVMFYHLPFAEDDKNGFRNAAHKSLPFLQPAIDARLLLEPFQTEVII